MQAPLLYPISSCRACTPLSLPAQVAAGAFDLTAPAGNGSADLVSLRGFDTSSLPQSVNLRMGSSKRITLRLTAPAPDAGTV